MHLYIMITFLEATMNKRLRKAGAHASQYVDVRRADVSELPAYLARITHYGRSSHR